MVKLGPSLEDAAAMGDPRVDVGKLGWVTVQFRPDDAPDATLLEAWVEESYRLLAPKTLVKQLDQS